MTTTLKAGKSKRNLLTRITDALTDAKPTPREAGAQAEQAATPTPGSSAS